MLREKLKAYIDANVPIIYVNSYDDNTVEESILKASGRRKVWEWNQMYGLLNRKEIEKREIHSIQEILDDNCTLEEFLKSSEGIGKVHNGFRRGIFIRRRNSS